MSYPQGSGRGPFGSINSGPAVNVTTKMQASIAQCVGTTFKSGETASLPTCLREDLLVTCEVPGAQASSVQHVTSVDLLSFDNAKKVTVNFDGQDFDLYMPTDYAQYACDVHDARTSIELVMAANQMCILACDSARNVRTYAPDPRVCLSTASGSVFMKPQGDHNLVLRRCVLYDSAAYPELTTMAAEIQAMATRDTLFKGLVQVYDLNPDRREEHERLRDNIKGPEDVRKILLGLDNAPKPKCTHKGGSRQTFTPPKFSYAGIAMTEAYINSVHGDTHVTCNLFSSITLTNGPAAVAHGDTLHWIWRVEMHYYTKDGSRLPRSSWVTTPVHELLEETYTNTTSNTLHGQPRANQRDSKMLQRVCENIYMVPLKEGFANQLLSAGILDRKNQRKVGHAISSAPAFGSLDIMHYGKGTNT